MISGPADTAGLVEGPFFYIVAVSVILLLIVTACMIFFLFRYNRKRHPVAHEVRDNLWLEIFWTVIPTILALSMFYFGWINFKFIRTPAHDAITINVIARKWAWLFIYDNKKQSDLLRVPQNRPVKLVMTSADVIHSLYIPAFRIKEDCVPGLKTYLAFTANELGTYDLFCTEYCGVGHSQMLSQVIVMPAAEFESWLNIHETGVRTGKGLKVMEIRGCTGCHSIDGSKKIGPTLKGLYGRKEAVITNGKERQVTVNDAFLEEYIRNPNVDIIKGYQAVMPAIPVSEEELHDIVEYIKTLQ
jgi:cytochrome c oxidase subunit II